VRTVRATATASPTGAVAVREERSTRPRKGRRGTALSEPVYGAAALLPRGVRIPLSGVDRGGACALRVRGAFDPGPAGAVRVPTACARLRRGSGSAPGSARRRPLRRGGTGARAGRGHLPASPCRPNVLRGRCALPLDPPAPALVGRRVLRRVRMGRPGLPPRLPRAGQA